MPRKREVKRFMADFETTVYEGQECTEVWAAAIVEIYTEDVKLFHSIGELFDFLFDQQFDSVVYFHNLKFDGSFIVSYLLGELGFTYAATGSVDDGTFKWVRKNRDMRNRTFRCAIAAEMGQWYSVVAKSRGSVVEFRDSLKLLPVSVKRLGESFGTRHRKLDMEYEGFRYAGCEITPEEREYIANDVLVVEEALEIMFEEGHDKLTIGSCCLKEYKDQWLKAEWELMFPNLYEVPLDCEVYGSPNVGEWVRKSFKGGWTYVVPGKSKRVLGPGLTCDVNSLYPSMMSGESENRYPLGMPTFWHGDYIPDEALENGRYYFVRVRTRFYLKPQMLPTVQIKGSPYYPGTEWLETSDVFDRRTGMYYSEVVRNGVTKSATVELTLTCTDFELLKSHYELVDFEVLDGCWFRYRDRDFRHVHRQIPQDQGNVEGCSPRDCKAVPQQPLREDGRVHGLLVQGPIPGRGGRDSVQGGGGGGEGAGVHSRWERHHVLCPPVHDNRRPGELPRPRPSGVRLRRHRLHPLRPRARRGGRCAGTPHRFLRVEDGDVLGRGVFHPRQDLHRARDPRGLRAVRPILQRQVRGYAGPLQGAFHDEHGG